MANNLLQTAGAQPQKQPKFVPIFLDRAFTGLYTQRAALHDPSDFLTARFYGGRADALLSGQNVELTNRLTLQRRPGLSEFSTTTYPTAPLRSFSFELLNGTIQVLIDTGSTGSLVLSAVANASTGTTVYTGVFPNGGSNAYVGMIFNITGFTLNNNNGSFVATASTTTTLTLANVSGVAQTQAAAAVSAGAVYWDQQNGSKTLILGKAVGAGQTYFVAAGGTLFMGDGVEVKKYTPSNTNGTIWNWGIAPPLNPPAVSVVQSGAASVPWQANTVWSTMGLIYDAASGTILQLNSVNASGVNTTQFGTSGPGQPTAGWNQTQNGTTTDNTVTWTNEGAVVAWSPNFAFGSLTTTNNTLPWFVYDPVTKAVYFQTRAPFGSGGAGSPRQNLSGATKPNFVAGVNQTTPDNQCIWQYFTGGIPGVWKSATLYGTNVYVSEPINLVHGLPSNQTVYMQLDKAGGTTGTGTSPFPAAVPAGDTFIPAGFKVNDNGDLTWLSLGSYTWAASTLYSEWTANGTVFSALVDANGNFQVCTTTGTSAVIIPGTSFVISAAANASGGTTTYTGTFTPTPPPNGSTVVITGFVTHTANNGTFTVISSTPTTLVVNNSGGIAESHAATAVYNPWATVYGKTTSDGTAVWTCVGQTTTWAGATIWYLPAPGFSPPSSGGASSAAYGGASIIDSNGDVEFVINSGLGGASQPVWNGIGSTTTDNAATWFNLEVKPAQSLSWTIGHVYAYSFKARSLTDYYSVPSGSPSAIPIPPGANPPIALPFPSGSETGAISTASPVFTITGSNNGAINTISGLGSTDPQVDTIVIWRDADGGGPDNMFELTEIPAPPPIGGIAQPWSFADYLPDTATSLYPGLNELIPAPIDDENDPPPSAFLPMVYNFQRIWGANGQEVLFSGGPDVITGNPNEAFNPSDEFPFLANVTRLVKTSQGLVVFLTNEIDFIGGGPATTSFYSVVIAPGLGLLNYNALDNYAGEIFFFSSDSQFMTLSPSLNLSSFGFPLGDKFQLFNASLVEVAVQQAGIDNGIYVTDGSEGWYRCNPRQIPGGISGPEPIWSTFAFITGGAQMVQSVEISPGIKKLLVGSPSAGQKILYRNVNVFTDDGATYDANFVMGSIMLAHPGQLAALKFLEMDFSGAKFKPTVSYLLNEISGSFTPFTQNPVFDPPSLYGTTISPASYSPNRYYFMGNASIALCRHMQIEVDFGSTSNGDELYNLTIFGRLFVET